MTSDSAEKISSAATRVSAVLVAFRDIVEKSQCWVSGMLRLMDKMVMNSDNDGATSNNERRRVSTISCK